MTDVPGLADRQAALVRALVAGAAVPPGFDRAAVCAAAHALRHKRAREVAARYPELVHAAGPDFTTRFVEWARDRPKVGTTPDALSFARECGIPWPPSRPGFFAPVARLFRRLRSR
ncbi:hypothetical protein [Nocardia jinanensis]|uniref:SCO6045-like C-terminal domain-containing protein n=1 Tax=Nocardia jinanensis TaxID=382504 RepID=A0A917RV91_9NOCA|nr:hypothetical protein [Nocardia jinanensis]GGL38865.1 hypothetical protein GCM10011588_61830 [Nocardia jinanensis]